MGRGARCCGLGQADSDLMELKRSSGKPGTGIALGGNGCSADRGAPVRSNGSVLATRGRFEGTPAQRRNDRLTSETNVAVSL